MNVYCAGIQNVEDNMSDIEKSNSVLDTQNEEVKFKSMLEAIKSDKERFNGVVKLRMGESAYTEEDYLKMVDSLNDEKHPILILPAPTQAELEKYVVALPIEKALGLVKSAKYDKKNLQIQFSYIVYPAYKKSFKTNRRFDILSIAKVEDGKKILEGNIKCLFVFDK